MMLIPFSSIFIILSFSYFVTKWLSTRRGKVFPPSPPKIPILGNLHQIGARPYHTLHLLSQRYGPLMLLHFGSKPVLVASSAETAREIMKTHDIVFANKSKMIVGDKVFYNSKAVAVAPYGEHWRQMKSICVLQLLSNRRVSSFRAAREERVVLLIDNIKKLSKLSEPVNLSEMFTSLTRDVICKSAFGKRYDTWDDNDPSSVNVKGLLIELMDLIATYGIGEYIPWLSWVNNFNGFNKRVNKTAKDFDQFLDEVIQEHVENMENRSILSDEGSGCKEEATDFVDVLLQLQKENDGQHSLLDTESLKALILDMFLGGTGTSSALLEWVMTELIRHPRVMKILRNEARQVSPNRDLIITESDLDKMHYLKLVIKETLRLHPIFPLIAQREVNQDVNVMGYDIPAKTMVIVNAWSVARDPTYWNKAEDFWPERFLNSSLDFKGQDFHYLPFGSGRRGCPGTQYGVIIVELVLANVVKMFEWSLPNGAKGEDLDTIENMGIAVHRKNPLVVIPSSCSDYST